MKTPSDSNQIIYPELSYEILGAAFAVFNKWGYGMDEKYYQRAYAQELVARGIHFKREHLVKVRYEGQFIGNCFLDFVVDDKIIVEVKVRPKIGYVHIRQVMTYLKAGGYRLAMIVYFTREGVKCRRVLNANAA